MAPLLRRAPRVACFFCQSAPAPPPRDPRSFVCPQCACWNRYDARGEIVSDEPAMHDESLNRAAFARRASPRKDRFLSTFGPAPFCDVCQSNQRLIVQLLSSYLPSSDDPEYDRRVASYDAYKASVHARYPPVCAACAAPVEEQIRKKDGMARADALGRWLRDSSRSPALRAPPGAAPLGALGARGARRPVLSTLDRRALERELRWWRVRGALCIATLGAVLLGDLAGAFGHRPPSAFDAAIPYMPVYVFVSVLWTAWDPTWASLRQAQLQGRKVRVRGKLQYASLQMFAWFARMLAACFVASAHHRPAWDVLGLLTSPASTRSRIFFAFSLFLELLVAAVSFVVLRLNQPPAVRLIDTTTRSRSMTPVTGPAPPPPPIPDHLTRSGSLTLAAAPEIHHPSPVFGLPSLLNPSSHPPTNLATTSTAAAAAAADDDDDDIVGVSAQADPDPDPDAMDWSPTSSPHQPAARLPSAQRTGGRRSDQATGLESLFARTKIAEQSGAPGSAAAWRAGEERARRRRWGRWALGVVSVALLVGVVYGAWRRGLWGALRAASVLRGAGGEL